MLLKLVFFSLSKSTFHKTGANTLREQRDKPEIGHFT